MEEDNELSLEKRYPKAPPQLRKYLFKVGNPGRPKGSKSVKTFAKEYLESLPDDEKMEFLNTVDPKTIWEMAEGKPKQDVDIDATISGPSAIILNE